MSGGDVSELIGAHGFVMARAEQTQSAAQDTLDAAAQVADGDDIND
jgi:hypothetical protein